MPNVLTSHPSSKDVSCGGTTKVIVSSNPKAAPGTLIEALPDDAKRVSVEVDAAHKNPSPADANGEAAFILHCQSAACPTKSKVVFHMTGYDDATCEISCSKLTTGITTTLETARPSLGLGLQQKERGRVVVMDVLPYSSAVSQVRLGDIIESIGEVEIDSLAAAGISINQLKVGEDLPVTIGREGKVLTLQLKPALLRIGKDVSGPSIDGFMCNESCRCKVKARATCQEEWLFVAAAGENGGVVYQKKCSAWDIDTFKVLTDFSCGRKEYF